MCPNTNLQQITVTRGEGGAQQQFQVLRSRYGEGKQTSCSAPLSRDFDPSEPAAGCTVSQVARIDTNTVIMAPAGQMLTSIRFGTSAQCTDVTFDASFATVSGNTAVGESRPRQGASGTTVWMNWRFSGAGNSARVGQSWSILTVTYTFDFASAKPLLNPTQHPMPLLI